MSALPSIFKASRMSNQELLAVSPALARYESDVVYGQVWARANLSKRDRSIVTLTALITRGQTSQISFHTGLALDNGVSAKEVSEILTHLAFYAGWGNALSALPFIAAFSKRVASKPPSFHWLSRNCSRSIRWRKTDGRASSTTTSGRCREAWSRTPARYCSAISGCDRISRHATGAW